MIQPKKIPYKVINISTLTKNSKEREKLFDKVRNGELELYLQSVHGKDLIKMSKAEMG